MCKKYMSLSVIYVTIVCNKIYLFFLPPIIVDPWHLVTFGEHPSFWEYRGYSTNYFAKSHWGWKNISWGILKLGIIGGRLSPVPQSHSFSGPASRKFGALIEYKLWVTEVRYCTMQISLWIPVMISDNRSQTQLCISWYLKMNATCKVGDTV
jgi:hypothetical protein